MSLAPAPVTFETWTNAALSPTFNSNAYTHETGISGTYSDFLSEVYSFSSYGKEAYDSTGGHTGIFTLNQPIIETQDDPNFLIAADNWIWGYPDIIGRTVQSDFIGTSETIVRFEALYGEGDDIPSLTRFGTTVSQTLASEPKTSETFKQWSTTNLASPVTTTQSSDTEETLWTHQTTSNSSDSEWITSNRAASTQGTTLTAGTSQIITSYNTTVTFESEEARSTKKITRSTATYNTLILASSTTPNALTTTASADPQEQSANTAFYGGLSYNEAPTLVSYEEGLVLSGGAIGYTTNLRTTTTSGLVFWSVTQTSNRASAGLSLGNNPPRVIDGEVIVSAAGGSPQSQEVTTTADVDAVVTHGETTTSLASFETMALGPGQTTRSFSYLADIDSFINLTDFLSYTAGAQGLPGFSISSSGPITMSIGYAQAANASVTFSALAVTVMPRAGFTSSIAALQTSRINTLKFAVVGAGGSGVTYADTSFLDAITAKSLSFAPKSAQEYLPVRGSASSSSGQTTFRMSYYGTRQSRTSTIGTGSNATVTSDTSAWSATGSPQTHWVHVSRGQVAGAPAFPTIPALIVAGTGQALLTNGLYETYSGNGSDRSSDSTWSVSVNRVTSFSQSAGVTAIKPLQYFPPITGTNAQTTSASFANNLTAQPLDD